MEGGDLSSEPLQSSNWEVYKDALEPQPSRRLVKAWERAPVTAHAPRLQGQKIWKRINTRSGRSKDNNDTAEAELEKEGNGSRKKMRLAGNKENIAKAPWLPSKAGQDVEEFPENPYSSPKKKDRRSLAAGEADALLVPRKRTNANHLITPRKHTRKSPLDGVAVTDSLLQNYTQLEGHKIPLHDESTVQSAVPAEKPTRRRKSMRKSTRRLTQPEMPSLVETAEGTPANKSILFGILGNSPKPIMEAAANQIFGIVAKKSQGTDIPVECQLEGNADVGSEEKLVVGDIQNEPSKAVEETPSVVDANEVCEKVLVTTSLEAQPENTSFEKSTESKIVEAESSVQDQEPTRSDSGEDHVLSEAVFEDQVTSEETTIFLVGLEPEIQQPILESIEEDIEMQIPSPAKLVRTPKKKGANSPRKGRMTPQQSSTRRSTRVTRGSSVQSEGLPLQPDVQPIEPTSAKLSRVESPGKPISVSKMDFDPAVSPFKDSISQDSSTDVMNTSAFISNEQTDLDTSHERISNIQQEVDQQLTEEIFAISACPRESLAINLNIISEGGSIEIIAPLEAPVSAEPQSDFNDRIRSSRSASPEPFAEVVADSSHPNVTSTPKEQVIESDLEIKQVPEGSIETLEVLEPLSITVPTSAVVDDTVDELSDDFQGTSTPNPSTTELVEAISRNMSPAKEELSDTDMLRNFLSRVKANKAAKAESAIPKRKRSLPHSPIQVALDTEDPLSPSSPQTKDEFDVSLPAPSPMKRRKPNPALDDEDETEPKSIRRSGRTRLPVKAAPLAAPSFIPVRRLGQEGDTTITLRRNEEKELAALTRVNTRKNKGGAVHPQELLKKKGDEKEDPAARQRALKEIFDEKAKKQGKKGKSVVWAEELVQFQTTEEKKVVIEEPEKEKVPTAEEKKKSVKVGMRSKMTLGMAANGTPAPKRKMKGRS